MDFATWLKENGIDGEKLDEKSRATMQAIYERGQKALADRDAKAEAAAAEARNEAIKAEQKRRAEIDNILDGVDLTEAQRAECVKSTPDQARALVLEAIRATRKVTAPSSPAPAVHVADVDAREHVEALQAGMLLTDSRSEEFVAREFGDKVTSRARRFRNLGPVGFCRSLLRLAGVSQPDHPLDVVREAFALSKQAEMGQRDASTFHLGYLLGNVANKSLLKGYNDMPSTWEKWCARGEVADYKTYTGVRASISNGFAEVSPTDGQIPHTTATEEYEQYSIKLYAEMFGISEQQMVNDDLGALTAVPGRIGADAKRFISKQVYTHLLANGSLTDSYSLFGTDHSNYISGTTSTLTATYGVGALDLLYAKFLAQKDKSGDFIDIRPRFLLCPPALANISRQLLTSNTVNLAPTAGVGAPTQMPNPWIGNIEQIVEPRLADSGYSGYSATAWYFIADPGVAETVKVFTLRGYSTPQVERSDMDFNTLGIRYRGVLRVGVKAMDYRGAAMSAGA